MKIYAASCYIIILLDYYKYIAVTQDAKYSNMRASVHILSETESFYFGISHDYKEFYDYKCPN